MASPAATKYAALRRKVTSILRADRRSLARADVQAIYGAAFVAQVAAWNAYVGALPECFFHAVSNPAHAQFHAIHTLASTAAMTQLDRFNTPNAENSRNVIISCTGYDPWPDWQWPARGMSALATRLRINEIMKVRHSLAHGFAMPGYLWTQAPTGATRLTAGSLASTGALLDHLVRATDAGLSTHVGTTFGVATNW